MFAAAGATGVALTGFMRMTSGAAPGSPTMVGLSLASGAMIVTLCRTAMPLQLRGVLVLALIGTMFLGVARTDLFGARRIGDQVAMSADQATANRAAIDSYATGVALGEPGNGEGADVALTAGRSGGGNWARDIDAAWRNRIGGHEARDIRIDGWVDEEGDLDGLTRVAVEWQVTHHFASQRCGRTSSAGRDRATMIQAIAEPMVRAVERTVRKGKASCP